MRATRALAAAVAAVLVAAGCGADSGPPLLLLGTEAGTAVVDGTTGIVGHVAPTALATPDGSLLVEATSSTGDTVVRATDVASNSERWVAGVGGVFEPRVASASGDLVALTPPWGSVAGGLLAPGRATTQLRVVHADGNVDEYEVAANVEPEAFALDGSSLVVITYLPAEAPTSYQVRRLDLATGELSDMPSPDPDLQEDMRGTARTQVWDPDGSRLYTLYTLTAGPEVLAFVHVLDLDEQWAHCVDLPAGLAATTAGLALADDAGTLYVADAAGGGVAGIDTTRLSVERTGELGASSVDPTVRSVVAVAGSDLFVGAGAEITKVDRTSLQVLDRFVVATPVVGLQGSPTELYVADFDSLAVLDPRTGFQLHDFVLVATTGALTSLGSRTIPAYTGSECAC